MSLTFIATCVRRYDRLYRNFVQLKAYYSSRKRGSICLGAKGTTRYLSESIQAICQFEAHYVGIVIEKEKDIVE